jgi:DNA-binding response OmpR family regulator
MPNKQILIVDPNAAASNYIRDMLQYYGCEVTTAPTWEKAQVTLQTQSFDVLLLDEAVLHRGLGTPLDWLRAQGHEHPVLIMSDMALDEIWNTCLSYGQVELLNKPVSPSTLKFMVDAALKKGHQSCERPVIRLDRRSSSALQAG